MLTELLKLRQGRWIYSIALVRCAVDQFSVARYRPESQVFESARLRLSQPET